MFRRLFLFMAAIFLFQSCVSAPIQNSGDPVIKNADAKTAYKWVAGGPVIAPQPEENRNVVSAKDPSVVFYEGKWHVFYTTCDDKGAWSMQFISFKDWKDVKTAKAFAKDDNPNLRGYHCAPQVFYFTPQKKWYMIFQSGQPQYSTNDNIDDNMWWTRPRDFFNGNPVGLEKGQWGPQWLDFFVICDADYAYLYFTGDNGRFYRSKTRIQDFPLGMGNPEMVLRYNNEGDLFEGGAVYKLKGEKKYLAVIEAIAKNGDRYYRSFTADSPGGEWKEDSGGYDSPFAGLSNVTFESGVKPWTRDISHGELIRDGYDETVTIDPANLQFLFQGMDPAAAGVEYFMRPYRLGLLKAVR